MNYKLPSEDVTGLIPEGKVIGFAKTCMCLEWVYDISYDDTTYEQRESVTDLGFNVGGISIDGKSHLLISLDCDIK